MSFWNTSTNNTAIKKANSSEMSLKQDAFADFFGASSSTAKQANKPQTNSSVSSSSNHNNDIYDYFIQEEPKKTMNTPQNQPAQKLKEDNLLDL